jgi:Flp pilus assembly protein protease CpaA
MSPQYILYSAIAVFVLMMIGLLLTAREFKQMTKQNSSADRGKDVRK